MPRQGDLPPSEFGAATDTAPIVHDEDGNVDILYYIDRLEEVVGIGKRVPFSSRVMVDEAEFLGLVDQLRETVPTEIQRAQRVVKEREAIIGRAQEEAAKILETARQQAEYIVSQQGVLNEARQRAEEMLAKLEMDYKASMGRIDAYALQQFSEVERAIQESAAIMLDAVRNAAVNLEQAKRHVGR